MATLDVVEIQPTTPELQYPGTPQYPGPPQYTGPPQYAGTPQYPASTQPVEMQMTSSHTTVNVAQPGERRGPASQNVRAWSTGMCNCCADCKTCCCLLCCYPCLLCTIASKMNESCLVSWCCPFGVVPLRTKLRTMYGIQGTICDDYCVNCWCHCCTVCQLDRELTYVGL